VVEVPGLSERPEDIEAYLRRPGQGGGVWNALAPAARVRVLGHGWSGNFRELANFVSRLPASREPGSLDEESCAEALRLGSSKPLAGSAARVATPVSSTRQDALMEAAAAALACFEADFNKTPALWEDVKQYIENYLKPALFARVSGAEALVDHQDANLAVLATRIAADRGTVAKQLGRYFARFRGSLASAR
jgi:DNA-binding NtrC family response regulator